MRKSCRARWCQCGHDRDAHRHYRRGSECAHCECPRWSPSSRLRRLLLRRYLNGGDQPSKMEALAVRVITPFYSLMHLGSANAEQKHRHQCNLQWNSSMPSGQSQIRRNRIERVVCYDAVPRRGTSRKIGSPATDGRRTSSLAEPGKAQPKRRMMLAHGHRL